MGLLNDVMYRPVELGRRRPPADGPQDRGPVPRVVVHAALSAVLGLVTVTAVLSLRAPAQAVDEGKALLIEQITERTDQRDGLEATGQDLAEEIAALQEELLRVSDPALVAELRRSELLAGALAVTGPGVVVELDDGDLLEGGALDPDSRVQDVDLKMVVNALWSAGAEAMAVNGQRLTSLTTVRTAGEAIWVNFVPLTAPYRVEAIGDAGPMAARFARSPAAATLVSLESAYGITADVTTAAELELPAGSGRGLRYATTPADVTSSTGSVTQEGTT
jgi:uncharacterized protein YlxW (UPF0749 family)